MTTEAEEVKDEEVEEVVEESEEEDAGGEEEGMYQVRILRRSAELCFAGRLTPAVQPQMLTTTL